MKMIGTNAHLFRLVYVTGRNVIWKFAVHLKHVILLISDLAMNVNWMVMIYTRWILETWLVIRSDVM